MCVIFVHGAIVSKDAQFVYGLLRPKLYVSRGLFRSPWSKGLRMGKICGGFVVLWSKRTCTGKFANRSRTERLRSRNTEGKMRRVFRRAKGSIYEIPGQKLINCRPLLHHAAALPRIHPI